VGMGVGVGVGAPLLYASQVVSFAIPSLIFLIFEGSAIASICASDHALSLHWCLCVRAGAGQHQRQVGGRHQ